MASRVVQFRAPADMVRFLQDRGINPNEAAREAFEGLYRRAKAGETYQDLTRLVSSGGIKLKRSPEDIMREERDSH